VESQQQYPAGHPGQDIVVDQFLPAPGELSKVPSLQVPKAVQLAEYLRAGFNPWARLVEVRRSGDGSETVVFDVELSQSVRYEVHPVERVAVSFSVADSARPEVVALRSDFPYVPHLNLRDTEFPRSLCLYEDNYAEHRLRWTAVSVVARVREWLRDTAAGTLHGEDQPLEPIFLGTRGSVVLPPDIFAAELGPEPLEIEFRDYGERGQFFLATRPAPATASRKGGFLAVAFVCAPIVHGAIRSLPQTLLDLHRFTSAAGLDLLASLRERIGNWPRDAGVLSRHLVLLVAFPKLRASGAVVEAWDAWAFVTNETLATIGEGLGIWQTRGGIPGIVIGGVPSEARIGSVGMAALNPTYGLSRAGAAKANGIEFVDSRITAVGMGALGSQLTANLLRAGYGRWTAVDGDIMLPHNAARHELEHAAVGWPKAMAMKAMADRLLAEPGLEGFIFADVLEPGDQAGALTASYQGADIIADFSASLAVSRHLCCDVQSPARRISAFLNPTGTDLVVLAEDAKREVKLDCLEMQYYREILTEPGLAEHFASPDGRVRYARSCRDVSTVLSQDQVALHSAIGARALRGALAEDKASIGIWSSGPDLTTRAFHIKPAPMVVKRIGPWSMVTDQAFLEKLQETRAKKLPKETGGVLLGAWDLTCHLIYLVDTIDAPPDSEERKTLFIRGSSGLRERVVDAGRKTGGMIQYIGEWHSHPDGYGTVPSVDDSNVFSWLSAKMKEDGFPPVMLILGESEVRAFVDAIDSGREAA
jgi:integrative and conjugative element protein (TIGR02256 family)